MCQTNTICEGLKEAILTLGDSTERLAAKVVLFEQLAIATAKRVELSEERMELIETANEEALFRQFTARYYSEALYDVKLEYEVELQGFDRLRGVILDLAAALPDELHDDIRQRLSVNKTTNKKVRSSGVNKTVVPL